MNLPDYLTRDTDGWIHLTGHRIGLEHLAYFYNEGHSAEMVACEYPTIDLSLIYKVFAFYLENRGEVDAYVSEGRMQLAELKRIAKKGPSFEELRQRLEAGARVGGR